MYGNCEYCGSFSNLNRFKSCASCEEINKKALVRAREIIDQEGPKTVFELAEMVSVQPEIIFTWLDQRRIQMKSFKYTCPACGMDMLNGICDCTTFPNNEEEQEEPQDQYPERFYSTRRIDSLRKRYWTTISKIRRRQRRDIWVST